MKNVLSQAYHLKLQNIILLLNRDLIFFSNGHIRNVIQTLPDIVKIDVENDNVALTLSNVAKFNVEIQNVVSTLLNVVNYNVDLTLCDVATSYQPNNNAEPTLKCFLGIYRATQDIFIQSQANLKPSFPHYPFLTIFFFQLKKNPWQFLSTPIKPSFLKYSNLYDLKSNPNLHSRNTLF